MAIKLVQQRQQFLQELLKRDHTLNGGILYGLDGYIIEMQARAMDILRRPMHFGAVRNGDGPVTKISGMARGAISESIDRITGAFAKWGIPDTEVSILINLAPADLPKEGTWLDLPLAILMLQASGYLPKLSDQMEGDLILMGELGLHGEVRRVPGALSIAFTAKPGQSLIVPTGNEKECALILAKPGYDGCNVYPVSTLDEVIQFFQHKRPLENALQGGVTFQDYIPKAVDFGQILGQEKAKEAACIAAAGGHNLLMIGPPGEGKSLIAGAIPGILPRLSNAEKVDLTKIYSAYGALEHDGMAVTRRPMRNIHHTASKQSLIGGGSGRPRPGEITLAHLGVLFLDEIAEFSRATLEALRQPIESGRIVVSRVGGSFEYPCRFTLVAAMNPCPCGFYGTESCTCRPQDVEKYHHKISGPILDRIDLQVELNRLSTSERFGETKNDLSPRLRAKIEAARVRQQDRFNGLDIPYNAAIPAGQIRELCNFSLPAFDHYKSLIGNHLLSTRSMDRLAKVARTVADLDNSDQIVEKHIDKAGSFVIGGMLRESS
ncbi:MAG TPA: YifB family Mg chelatase-like AAA ATPase [Pirellulales bacterium]|jgi:magnesium chelatase family protein|nr:YifB family Mg chelatase-like AAA ATPase [Pirellulales bacterium]